jgi:hypothetical protein
MALGLLLALFVAVVAPLHGILPLWVEGMPEYLDQLAGAIGRPCTAPLGALRVGQRYIPLAVVAYQGPLMTYLDIPAAYLWYSGVTSDLYLYRYKGIVVLALSSFLFFAVLRRFLGSAPAFLAALVFVTLPINVLCSIGDLQHHLAVGFGILCATLAFVLYLETKRPGWFWATAALAGVALWTRAEALIWPVAALVAFGAFFRRKELTAWWRATGNRGRLLLLSAPAFLVGAAPTTAYNVVHPRYGLVAFLLGGARMTASGLNAAQIFRIRLAQFVNFNLLDNWGQYVTRSGEWIVLVAFAASCAVVLALWVKRRRVTFPLFALAIVLPLSVFCNRGPREHHLLPLMLLVVAVVAEAAAAVPTRLRGIGLVLLGGVLIANVAVCRSDLADWRRNANVGDTLLNHSDPALLVSRLEPYRNDALYFTNIGLYQEAVWGSRGRLCGKDILKWGDDQGFETAVRQALSSPAQRVVFVGFPSERERRIPERALLRTDILTATLRASGLRWRSEVISFDGLDPRYELFVVEKSEVPPTHADSSPPRVEGGGANWPSGGKVTGWVTGAGFRIGDVIVIDGNTRPTTAFGNAGWLTFAVDEASMTGRRTLGVEVVRPSTGSRSQHVMLKRP